MQTNLVFCSTGILACVGLRRLGVSGYYSNRSEATGYRVNRYIIRVFILFWIFIAALTGSAQTPPSGLWNELKAKREKLSNFHQEFEVTQTRKYNKTNDSLSSKREIFLDVSRGQFRERSISGTAKRIRIFDGKDLLWMEDGGSEYVRNKLRPKEDVWVPSPYAFTDPDWSKTVELQRRPCGMPGNDHLCVTLEVPLKKWMRNTSLSNRIQMLHGSARILLDTETGLLLWSRTVEVIDNSRGGYESDTAYVLKRMSYGGPADASLFNVPPEMREVERLSPWNAAKVKKELTGKPAPELMVSDLQGKPVTLAAFKGRIVLLDFWTTWCPPCRHDAPALEKLYRRYGDKDLTIIGIAVSEPREVVEKFLKGHPHTFPIVLTAENELPLPYQVTAFPTYIVIDRDGSVGAAVEGDQGFGELSKLLKKAGLETE
jgi:thiol-disulfide isomerase/thioredoxin